MRPWVAGVVLSSACATAAAGDVTGVVRLAGGAPTAAPIAVTKDQATCGETVPDEGLVVTDGRLANVVLTVKGAPPPPPSRATLDQRRCRYVPHVMALSPGSVLEVANGDPLLHSAHGWAGKASRFDVVTPEQGMRVPTRLDRAGLIQVRCDVHGWMHAYVVVADGPAAVSGGDGSFSIAGVPPGTYTLTAWHERLGERTTRVTVPQDGGVQVEVTFGE